MSHPDGLPDLFIDRSLARIKVPTLCGTEGLGLVTLAEHSGSQDVGDADGDWLELSANTDGSR